MSNGGEESSEREYVVRENSEKKLGGDDFALAIGRIVVAQVCDNAVFHGFHQLALNAFSNLATRYIRQIGKSASFYATLSGRSESNVLDIILGLEDLGLPQGFSGASNTGQCISGSGIVREIAQYMSDPDDSFAYSIPSFPVVNDEKRVPSFAQVGDLPPGEHIPTWLPAFPRTYLLEREVDKRIEKIETLKQNSKVQKSMVVLQQYMSCHGSEVPIAVDMGDGVKAKLAVEGKLFLAPPLKFGEREVALVVIPANLLNGDAMREHENDVVLFEPFSPVDKPMKSQLKDSEEVKEKVLPNRRSMVRFKLKSYKKPSGASLSLKIDVIEQMNSMFGNNNDNHEIKRRAELIVKESMDIVEEFAEL